jgi:hypothetical protein
MNKWINIFVRDFLLIFTMFGLQYMTRFNSKTIFLIMGMMIVWMTWQLSDLISEIKFNRAVNNDLGYV